jgi:hypothetical protein
MRYTLLEMVQLILSAMDSDEVNSISDTVESNQVALLLKSVYYDIATDIRLPEHASLFELNASGDVSKPVQMTIPTNVTKLLSVKYDTKAADETYTNHVDLKFVPFEEFYQRQLTLRNWDDTSDVGEMAIEMNGESFPLLYLNDKQPQYYTTLGEEIVLFDSYDSSIENTLQKSKTLCTGHLSPAWTMEDSFIPVLEPTQFSYLVNKAKTRAFKELKQQDNDEAAAEARRQKVIVQKRQERTPDVDPIYYMPRYGRK